MTRLVCAPHLVATLGLALAGGCIEYSPEKQQGLASDRPEIQVTPTHLHFGEVGPGESIDEVFTIASVGTLELEVADLRLSGEGAASFTLTTDAVGAELAPGESLEAIVTYSPSEGTDEAVVIIDSNDPTKPQVVVELDGAGLLPILSIEPSPVSYGFVEPGLSVSQTVDLVNTGGAPLSLTNAVVLGEGFSLDAPLVPLTLAPSEWTTVDITFNPTAPAAWSGELWVSSDAANATNGSNKAVLEGSSIEQPIAVCSVTPAEAFAVYDDISWLGRDSYDPGGLEIVAWEWSLLSRPEGSTASMPYGTADRTGFVADLVGTYMGELVVTNEEGTSSEPCIAILEAVPSQDLWVEMFWTHSGDDMDLHLLAPGGTFDSNTTDCHWENCVSRRLDWGETGLSDDDPSLDIDDIPGTGPENINILRPEDATYEVYVHDWPGSVYSGDNDTTVRIYLSGDKVYEDTKTISGEDSATHFATVDWPNQAVIAH